MQHQKCSTFSKHAKLEIPKQIGEPFYRTDIIRVLKNVDGVNDATIDLSISGSAYFNTRRYLLKTVDVPADSTVVVEKPINLGAGDKLETKASVDGDIDVYASILEIT